MEGVGDSDGPNNSEEEITTVECSGSSNSDDEATIRNAVSSIHSNTNLMG
jgi:hypothetical protein